MKAMYIGDSVYCRYNGFSFEVFTDNGYGPQNLIYMEDHVMQNFMDYVRGVYNGRKEQGPTTQEAQEEETCGDDCGRTQEKSCDK